MAPAAINFCALETLSGLPAAVIHIKPAAIISTIKIVPKKPKKTLVKLAVIVLISCGLLVLKAVLPTWPKPLFWTAFSHSLASLAKTGLADSIVKLAQKMKEMANKDLLVNCIKVVL